MEILPTRIKPSRRILLLLRPKQMRFSSLTLSLSQSFSLSLLLTIYLYTIYFIFIWQKIRKPFFNDNWWLIDFLPFLWKCVLARQIYYRVFAIFIGTATFDGLARRFSDLVCTIMRKDRFKAAAEGVVENCNENPWEDHRSAAYDWSHGKLNTSLLTNKVCQNIGFSIDDVQEPNWQR